MGRLITGIILVVIIAGAALAVFRPSVFDSIRNRENVQQIVPDTEIMQNGTGEGNDQDQNGSDIVPPLDRARDRVTKKPFGVLIDPATSPVQPERFRGYHTGTDFEVFPDELNTDVPVRAICSGAVVARRNVPGYGGVFVQRCDISNERVTVLYGHLALRSIMTNLGDAIVSGDQIGLLGADKSPDTDNERKHLHLSIHKGTAIDTRGYVTDNQELSEWMDPCTFVCQ